MDLIVVNAAGWMKQERWVDSKKDSPEPPRLSPKPSRLEGQLDGYNVPVRCCKAIAD